jgi:hypothetical protein
MCLNVLCLLHITDFTAVMCLSQFRAVYCFIEKIPMVSNVMGCPAYEVFVQGADSKKKKLTAIN